MTAAWALLGFYFLTNYDISSYIFESMDFVIADGTQIRAFDFFVRSCFRLFISLLRAPFACFSKYQIEQLKKQNRERERARNRNINNKKWLHFAIDRNSSRKKMYWLFAHERASVCVCGYVALLFSINNCRFLFEISAPFNNDLLFFSLLLKTDFEMSIHNGTQAAHRTHNI